MVPLTSEVLCCWCPFESTGPASLKVTPRALPDPAPNAPWTRSKCLLGFPFSGRRSPSNAAAVQGFFYDDLCCIKQQGQGCSLVGTPIATQFGMHSAAFGHASFRERSQPIFLQVKTE